MRRRQSVLVVFGLALVASLSVHLPVWSALGVLAKSWSDAPALSRSRALPEPQFMELLPLEVEEASNELLDEAERDPEAERGPTRRRQRVEVPELESDPEPLEEEPEEEEPEPEDPPESAPPPDAQPAQPTPVRQNSQNPDEVPEATNRIARENNSVEEETVAEVTNLLDDAEDPNAGQPQEPSELEELGNANEAELREMEDEEGPDDQMPAPEVATEVAAAAAEQQNLREARGQIDAQEAQDPNAAPAVEMVTMSDPFGTFQVAVPRRSGTRGSRQDEVAGQEGRRGSDGQGPNLRISWRQFEGVIGEEALRQEREAYAEQVLTRVRGSNTRERDWRQFRAAIENFVPEVRRGNQTALNARASPFAEWLHTLHARIHVAFHNFLDGLGTSSSNPMNDPSLKVRLELVFAQDGSIARYGVVSSSGVLPYDLGAFSAVRRAGPFPAPPAAIHSGNGMTYVHWVFERVPPYCHGQNAHPYILDNAPSDLPSSSEQLQLDSQVSASGEARNGPAMGGHADSSESEEGEVEERDSEERTEGVEGDEHDDTEVGDASAE